MKRPKFLSAFDVEGVSRAAVNLPAILAALESSYFKACDRLKTTWEQHDNGQHPWGAVLIAQDEVAELKSALQSAGYIFDTEPAQS